MNLKELKTGYKIVKTVLGSPVLSGAALGTAVFAADRLFKDSVERKPEEIFPHPAAPDGPGAQVEICRLHNRGIAMGRLGKTPDLAKSMALAGAGTALLSLVTRDRADRTGKVSDLVVLGGAASNLYDRVKYGYVVDYIHMKKGPLSKIVFNLGDAAIAAGAAAGSVSRALTCSRKHP